MTSLENPIAINNRSSSIIPKINPTNFDGVDTDNHFGLYLREVIKFPLLKREEEVALAKLMEQGRAATEMIENSHFLTKHKRNLLERQRAEGDTARKYLISANGQLVINMAKRYVGQGVPLLDLIQEGNLGLMRAADKFDWRRGFKFSTSATWWVRKAVISALNDQGRNARQQSEYFDQFANDNHLTSTEAAVIPHLLRGDLEVAMEALSFRQERVLRRHHGWDGQEPQTLKDIGISFKRSRSRIQQIKDEAIEKLSRRDHLKAYLE